MNIFLHTRGLVFVGSLGHAGIAWRYTHAILLMYVDLVTDGFVWATSRTNLGQDLHDFHDEQNLVNHANRVNPV